MSDTLSTALIANAIQRLHRDNADGAIKGWVLEDFPDNAAQVCM